MEKKYKYNNGVLEETQENAMIGFTYTQDGVNKRIIYESTAIYNHTEYAESKFVIQAQIGQSWVTISNEIATVSKQTYCYANGDFEPEPFEEVDGQKVLKSGITNEWDFYYPMFFTAGVSAPSLHSFVKHGAELKAGITL